MNVGSCQKHILQEGVYPWTSVSVVNDSDIVWDEWNSYGQKMNI